MVTATFYLQTNIYTYRLCANQIYILQGKIIFEAYMYPCKQVKLGLNKKNLCVLNLSCAKFLNFMPSCDTWMLT